ncbi:MAG TPA: hemolysin family protein [Mycobacteriales bacterium]|nr:hemolysin family protein [Mycobacteriales bacterium]
MTSTDVWLLVLAAVLVVVAGLLACVEAATARMSPTRVEKFQREGRRGADRLGWITADPPRYLNLLLLLRMLGELGATSIVVLVAARELQVGNWVLPIVTGLMTVVSYVLIGVAPRTLGVQRADTVALRASGFVVFVTRVFGPLPRLLILIGNALTPGKGFRDGPFATESELRDLVDLAEERQVIAEGERDMIHSVFELGDTIVREVMIPRLDLVTIERTKTARQTLNLALRSGFSRIPVVGEDADDVVGIVYLKDLVRRAQDGKDDVKVDEVMRAPTFVPDSKPVDQLLREMQKEQIHMAVVVDEYGGTAGLVTIEDILEEIVGEIADEYDREAPQVEQLDSGGVRVISRLSIDEVNEMFDVELPTEDADTIAGLLASELGRVPIPGASVILQGLRITAESAKGRRNRIGTVLIERASESATVRSAD